MEIRTKIWLSQDILTPLSPGLIISEEQHNAFKKKVILDIELHCGQNVIHLEYEDSANLEYIFQQLINKSNESIKVTFDLFFNDFSTISFSEQSDNKIRIDFSFIEGIQKTIVCEKHDLIIASYDFLILIYSFFSKEYKLEFGEEKLKKVIFDKNKYLNL